MDTMPVKTKLNDTWFRFLGIPFIAFMSHTIFFNEQHMKEEGFSYWEVFFIALGEAVLLWETNRLVLRYVYSRYGDIRQSRQRIAALLIGCLVVTVVVRYLNIWFYNKTLFWGYVFPPEGIWYNILIALLYVIIIAGIYEAFFSFRQWKRSLEESEALKREQLQTQLDSLKAQVNPHFLFNNLGSLASLIMEDQGQAVRFVQELSSVYRYVLQANEKDLTPLKAELTFLDQYFHLLKIRFGEGIELVYQVAEEYLDHLLPPLTLQLLVENAVKHNAILPESPLVVQVYTDEEGRLVVTNNRQKKAAMMGSHKMGLHNISTKYRLLKEGEVEVTQTDTEFRVAVPLIKKHIYEPADRRR